MHSKVALLTLWSLCQCVLAHAQSGGISSHPDGDTPLARMSALAHTEALPRCDKVEVFALKPEIGKAKNDVPKDRAFPIRPYAVNAEIVDHTTLSGASAEKIVKAWRSMAFDKFAGAFCHEPAYGLRFYREDKLLFETSVCWKCQNFYIPEVTSKNSGEGNSKGTQHQWYGFEKNSASEELLALLRKELPLRSK